MTNIYFLKNAMIFNPRGKKYNAIASPAALQEVREQKEYFGFDFEKLLQQDITVYKICKEGEPDIIHGLVGFTPDKGILRCMNMEISHLNKRGISLYSGIGKCMVALCCKISFDSGLDGYITFEAKNRLMPYYTRYGAVRIGGLRMAVVTKEAQKLVDLYF